MNYFYTILLSILFLTSFSIDGFSQNITVNGAGSTIIIVNNDGSNEGLNDTALGDDRKDALEYAAQLLADRLVSNVPIRIGFAFNDQTCTQNGATLGSAGATSIYRDFCPNASSCSNGTHSEGTYTSSTWYHSALADSIAGYNLNSNSGDVDINAVFNKRLDDSDCFGNAGWYYGTDADPGGNIDFVTVALHEMLHGLGFSDFIGQDGSLIQGLPGTYDSFLYYFGLIVNFSQSQRADALTEGPDLLWDGGDLMSFIIENNITQGITGSRAQMYAPSTYNGGSSISHFNTTLNTEIMEPSYTGPNHNLDFTLSLMKDIGWLVTGDNILTINKDGTGSGSVTSSPSGIDCGSDCSESFEEDTVVQLTATADSGSEFSNWSGDCSGTNNVTNVTMSQTRSCTAVFNSTGGGSENLALSGSASQSSTGFGGSASRAVDGNTDGNWQSGSVSHTQRDGFPYSWWQVDLGDLKQVDQVRIWNRTNCCSSRLSDFYVFVSEDPFTSNNVSQILDQPGVTEFFVNSLNGQDSITINTGSVDGRYVRVQLTGQEYLHMAEVEVFGTDSVAPPPVNYDLSVNLQGTGSGSVTSSPSGIDCGSDCTESFEEDTVVQLTATADSGSEFSSWGGDCGGTGSVTFVSMSQARNCTAAFDETVADPENLALSGSASQSSTGFGGLAGRANDGNTNGNWGAGSISHTQRDGFPYSWWQVDLGDLKQVDQVRIWNRTNCCSSRLSDFYVFVSEQPFTSNNVSEILGQSGVTEFFVGSLNGQNSITINTGSVDGRYVRVQLTGQEYLHMAEVEVIGFD